MREIKFRAWIDCRMPMEDFMIYSENDLGDFFDHALYGFKYILMQFTGLKDKNGQEIYEGDILDCGDRCVQVTWHEGCGMWDSEFIEYCGDLTSNGISPVEWKYRAKIIGNIYERR